MSHYMDSVATPIEWSKPTLCKNDLKSVLETLIQDGVGSGKTVLNFESELARVFEFSKALTTTTLFSAYHLAFLSLGVGSSENPPKVVLATNAPIEALDALRAAGGEPLIFDLAPDSYHPDENTLLEALENADIVLLNYPYGSYHDYAKIWKASSEKNFKIIADISYIAGMEDREYIGRHADIALIGLHEDMLMTIGKGGVILTDSKKIFAIAKDLRFQGGSKPYRMRFDYSITDYQAAMGMEQLTNLGAVLHRRRKIGSRYIEALAHANVKHHFRHPNIDSYGSFPVCLNYETANFDKLMKQAGIEIRNPFKVLPLSRALNLPNSNFPNTEKLHQKGRILPLYPTLGKAQVERILKAVASYC